MFKSLLAVIIMAVSVNAMAVDLQCSNVDKTNSQITISHSNNGLTVQKAGYQAYNVPSVSATVYSLGQTEETYIITRNALYIVVDGTQIAECK